ncbi:hypothetical protein BRC82_05705 [Halobacteriales archaeon QS_1_67_19]|nr:MAG: hypothetical protein BRC82_05705 [Halobacteriales archaeon QS_1_67_19]
MRVLADGERRAVLAYLFDRRSDEPVAVGDLATLLADSDEHHRQTLTALCHTHLPKLDDAGLVSFERSDRTVSLADTDPLVTDALEAADAL